MDVVAGQFADGDAQICARRDEGLCLAEVGGSSAYLAKPFG
jgi:hypothetical protein